VPQRAAFARGGVTGPHGADLHTPAALEKYLEGRPYQQLFTWPEQGLVVYMVGSQ